jgi:DNA-binding XRE family transcriptional regulator
MSEPTKLSAKRLANYIRMHRKRAGLTQRELGLILGYGYESPVSRHERFRALPSLIVALSYEAVFHVPVSEIFAGVHEAVALGVEERLSALEAELRKRIEEDIDAVMAAKKLTWIAERISARRNSML